MESNRNLDLTLKCLGHLVFGGESTQRVIESTGENLPESVKGWKPAANFPSIFSSLGIEVKDFPGSSLPTEKIVGTSFLRDNKEVTRIDKSREKYNQNCKTPPPIIQQIKPAPLRSRLAGISTFNPPRRISPAKSAVKNPAPEVSVPPRGSRFYPPSVATKLSLYETYEERKSSPPQSSQKPVTFENVSNVQPKIRARGREDEEEDRSKEETGGGNPFRTAHEQLVISDRAKGIKRNISSTANDVHLPGLRKVPRVEPPPPPTEKNPQEKEEPISDNPEVVELMQNPAMKNIDPKMVEAILNEVLDAGSVDWHDIAGLEGVKNIIKEIILKPMLRPDIFTGLRAPPKGILLFGPPGTGKTMIGRLIATRSKFSFFNISASSLTSKWIGDGEKMVRALFAVARAKQPAVVFIDEIDSILTQRSDTEHESSRRLKTEFLIQFDGCGSKSEDRILIIGVTNRPRELDDAARRRFVKRIYIPLPDIEGRRQLVKNLIKDQKSSLDEAEYEKIAEMTQGYSGADMATLCQEAAYGPIRDVDVDIENISLEDVRPINLPDFEVAMELVKPSVDPSDLCMYEEFDRQFGCQAVKPRAV